MDDGQSSEELTEVGGTAPSRSGAAFGLGQGDAVGRYVVLSRLGAGGMGVVYAAYDPELDRKLALKLLHAPLDGDDEAAGHRLLREAQAMAKLSHPNAIGVHDVGEHQGRVYVAMEFVEGVTLEVWRGHAKRSVRDVIEVFAAAGRGLAAAHACGLVHRDFKPDNVMVGVDGRVRVMDFGLARPAAPTVALCDGLETEQSSDVVSGITHAGSIIGTPAYMAPEQHSGLDVGPAADQFAFCVALWEALYEERPFRGSSLVELAAQVCAGSRRPPPSGANVPAWLRRICERGLLPEPERRFHDMPALLAALARGRSQARTRTIIASLVGVGLVVAGGYGYDALDRSRTIAACAEDGASIDELWNSSRQEEVRAAMLGTELSYADSTSNRIVPWLDAHAREWADARTTACERAEVDRIWDEGALERANWCLDERRTDLDALLTELGSGRRGTVEKAVRAAAGLDRVDACLDAELLARLPEPPADSRDAVLAVRRELARARALRNLGDYPEALGVAKAAASEAAVIGWPPLAADGKATWGQMLHETAAYEESEAQLEAAFFEASASGATAVALDAAVSLVFVVGYRRERPDDAKRWARHAQVLSATVPDPLHMHEIARNNELAIVEYVAGNFAAALELHEHVLVLREAALGSDHPAVELSLNNLATVHEAMGDHATALPLMLRALASMERVFGPDHPDVGMALSNLGNVYRGLRQYDDAIAVFERSLAVRERALGPDHPDVAATLDNFGVVLRITGKVAEARAMHERALAIFESSLGPDHPSIALTLNNLGAAAQAEEDYAEALLLAERALAIREKKLDPEHPHLAASLDKIAGLHRVMGSHAESWRVQQRSLAIWEKAVGSTHPYVAYALVGLADAATSMGRPKDAVPLAERAIVLRSAGEIDPPLLAEARFVLARALYDADDDARARAVALAEQARDVYRDAGAPKAAELAAVETWLESHASAGASG